MDLPLETCKTGVDRKQTDSPTFHSLLPPLPLVLNIELSFRSPSVHNFYQYRLPCHCCYSLYSSRQFLPAIRDSLRVRNLVLNELLTPSKYNKIIE